MTITFDTNTNQRLIQDWALLTSAHDVERLLELFSDDVVYEDITLGVINRGQDELRAFVDQFFARFPDIAMQLTSNFATPTYGAAEWSMRGTQADDSAQALATPRRFELCGASIMEFANGRIRRLADYWDRASLIKQLG
jgi:steroid delta-isomerase-like uncharacterized protein